MKQIFILFAFILNFLPNNVTIILHFIHRVLTPVIWYTKYTTTGVYLSIVWKKRKRGMSSYYNLEDVLLVYSYYYYLGRENTIYHSC